jgi:ABC-type transport system involved in cytochrome c biogenesis permease component
MSSSSFPVNHSSGFLRRIWILAGHTFTQLVRMKIFYFMLVFCVVIFVAGFLVSSISPDQELKLLKDTAFGVMQIFSAIFGMIGMALLLPKDMEDRTLYTILSKPVRRWEYLLGKFFGVLLVLAVCLLVMDALALLVLQLKFNMAVDAAKEMLGGKLQGGVIDTQTHQESVTAAVDSLRLQGPRWVLQTAVAAIFMKAAVATAIALLVSTFAGSTIFTILISLSFYVAGHMQSSARETILTPEAPHSHLVAGTAGAPQTPPEAGVPAKMGAAAIGILFPDFQIYNVVDAIVIGRPVPPGAMGKMIFLTLVYLLIYTGLAALIFAGKEL